MLTEKAGELLKTSTFAKRVVLAGALLTNVSCTGTQVSQEKPMCPTSPTEVSRLVGGDPRNWKQMEGIPGAWAFKSDQPEVLNGARVGRVDTKEVGQIGYGLAAQKATEAWYVCTEQDQKTAQANPALTSTQVPSK